MTMTVGGTHTVTTTDRHLGRWLLLLAGLVAISVALPFIFLGPGPSWYHLAFHLIGITVCVLAVLTLRAIRRATCSKAIRVLSWISTVAFAGWAVGHTGELVTVLTHGGAHADEELFENPVHVFFATIAIPAWMLTVVSSLVLLVTATAQAIVRRVRR